MPKKKSKKQSNKLYGCDECLRGTIMGIPICSRCDMQAEVKCGCCFDNFCNECFVDHCWEEQSNGEPEEQEICVGCNREPSRCDCPMLCYDCGEEEGNCLTDCECRDCVPECNECDGNC